ncbi:hypothetical protein CYJ15_06505 [Heyndrickxia coagulans]|nr:hypothetical protein CYJ15_06505 [Heyndrickxia coagulans]
MFFSSCQKDKTPCIRARNVFLKLPKGQNTLHLGSECPFESQKDKTSCIWARNVFLKLSKGQNKLYLVSECPFEAAKRTKGESSPGYCVNLWANVFNHPFIFSA